MLIGNLFLSYYVSMNNYYLCEINVLFYPLYAAKLQIIAMNVSTSKKNSIGTFVKSHQKGEQKEKTLKDVTSQASSVTVTNYNMTIAYNCILNFLLCEKERMKLLHTTV